ncbi:MAG: penicillin acylase family protein, partial [Planctomycetota bacterium]|nr:penicillin acylase family protein [Planctomycetota bacterium]
IGWVQNCNNDPSTTTGTDLDPRIEDYVPGTVKGTRKPDTVRAWYLRQLLAAEPRLDAERAREILADPKMIPHGPMRDRLEAAWEGHSESYPDRDLVEKDVMAILEWDGMPDVQSPIPTLFLLWLFTYADAAMVSVDFLTRPLDTIDDDDAFRMFDTLRDSRKRIGKLLPFGSDLPWGLAHVIRKGGRSYSVATGMYPAISLLNANADLRGSDISKMQCTIGSAYVALHEMSDPPRSWTITPIGQTDRRDRPYLRRSTELFAQARLKPLPLTLEQLAEHETTELVLETGR